MTLWQLDTRFWGFSGQKHPLFENPVQRYVGSVQEKTTAHFRLSGGESTGGLLGLLRPLFAPRGRFGAPEAPFRGPEGFFALWGVSEGVFALQRVKSSTFFKKRDFFRVLEGHHIQTLSLFEFLSKYMKY